MLAHLREIYHRKSFVLNITFRVIATAQYSSGSKSKKKQFIIFLFLVSDEFMCYICNRTSSHPHNILEHTMKNHAGPDKEMG
jgi:hypothetical protein